MPRTKRNKGRVDGHKLKIQGILDNLNASSTPLDGAIPTDSHDAAATPAPESGAPFAPPSPILYGVLIRPVPNFSTSIFQPTDAWSDVHSRCMNSPP